MESPRSWLTSRPANGGIHALKTRLGAAARFEAGLQAALRGWVTDTGARDGRTLASERIEAPTRASSHSAAVHSLALAVVERRP